MAETGCATVETGLKPAGADANHTQLAALPERLRPIVPVPLPVGMVRAVHPGGEPQFLWVKVEQLAVNTRYQRDLSERSYRLIRDIAAGFEWRKFKPPIVVPVPDAVSATGLPMYEIVDGQHTASGIASHGFIERLPVMVVEAAEASAAGAFVSHNSRRIEVMKSQMLHAQALAGDEDALTVQQVCARAGVRLLKVPPSRALYKPGDCIAVMALLSLVSQRGAMRARIVLEAARCTDAAPISAILIKAIDLVLNGEDHRGTVAVEDLKTTLQQLTRHQRTATEMALMKRIVGWKALGIVLFQASRKTRKGGGDA